MEHLLPKLPFARDALDPVISEDTINTHYGKHHKGYIDKLNQLIPGTQFEKMSLPDIVTHSTGAIFNNASQAWNHDFYWHSLTPPNAGRKVRGPLRNAIEDKFRNIEAFEEKFQEAAAGIFGSGWAWLVVDTDSTVAIETTANAESPLLHRKVPILVVDVWEHAYYIDYRNERTRYLKELSKILNWDFAEHCFESTLLSQAV